MIIETEVQKIDRLSSILEIVVAGEVFAEEQLNVWTELAYFLWPDRLMTPKFLISNEEIFTSFEEHLNKQWADQGLRASILLIYVISVQGTVGISARGGRIQSDDLLGDAINTGAFQFIYKIVKMHKFHEHHASVELIDVFVKYFIINCASRIQDLLNVCEDKLSNMPSSDADEESDRYPLHFQVLLKIITRLYESDTPQLKKLSEQFFSSDFGHLSRFILAGVDITSPSLYVDYIKMLESLCKTKTCSIFLLHHFNSNHEILYDWAGLFGTLHHYVEVFQGNAKSAQTMCEQDLMATMAWIRLATTISKHCPEACHFFVFNDQLNAIDTLVLAATSSMPSVLKGEVYKFLAVLASDENSIIPIWNVLIRESVCVPNNEAGRLVGIRAEFKDVECKNGTYESTLGFLHLTRSLFSHRNLPDSKIVTTHVYFIVQKIICQCDIRSYQKIQQMWDMLHLAFDCLFQLIRHFDISASTVSSRTPQLFVLSQLLSDTDLSQTLVLILTECANTLEETLAVMDRKEYSDHYCVVVARNEAAKSGLRLLSYTVNVHSTLQASLSAYTGNGSAVITSLEAILLTPLTICDQQSYISMLTVFLEEHVILLPHTYYIIRILRRLAVKRNSEVHDVLLQIFQSSALPMKWIFARLMSINVEEESKIRKMEVSNQDMISFDLEDVEIPRLRGEIAFEVLELSIEIMEVAPDKPNLSYFLFGFDLSSWKMTKTIDIELYNQNFNCLHSLFLLIITICEEKDLYKLPYSALFGPALRLFVKFCNVRSLSSEPMLRLMKNKHNIISKLAKSPVFQYMGDESNISVDQKSFNCKICGLIQQLIK